MMFSLCPIIFWSLSLIILASSLSRNVCGLAFTPTIQPKFDAFLENIVASWHVPGGSQEQVEEVMRSCGGAVQGIRDNGIYLNRANDGFLYFDCGSYSYGPVDLKSMDNIADTALLSSIALPSSDTRIYVEGDVEEDGYCEGNIAIRYPKVTKVNEDTPMFNDAFQVNMMHSHPPMDVIYQVQCRMLAPSQPWMLQRAQWEKFGNDSITYEKLIIDDFDCPLGWMASQPQSNAGCEISVGTACRSSGIAKVIMRSYNSVGKLEKVSLQYGMLKK